MLIVFDYAFRCRKGIKKERYASGVCSFILMFWRIVPLFQQNIPLFHGFSVATSVWRAMSFSLMNLRALPIWKRYDSWARKKYTTA